MFGIDQEERKYKDCQDGHRIAGACAGRARKWKFLCLFGRLSLNSLSLCAITVREEPNLHVNPTSEMSQT